MDERTWWAAPVPSGPRPQTPPTEMPRLTLSPGSSNDSIDRMTPSTPPDSPQQMPHHRQKALPNPNTQAPSTQKHARLPSFHFSTTDENVDPVEFHRAAAQLLSGRSRSGLWTFNDDKLEAPKDRQLRCDLGKDLSNHYCSRDLSHSTFTPLSGHMQQCASLDHSHDTSCDRNTGTQDEQCRQSPTTRRFGNEANPRCVDVSSIEVLSQERIRRRDGRTTMSFDSIDPMSEIDDAYKQPDNKSTSQQYWIYDGDLSWSQDEWPAHDKLGVATEYGGVVEQTLSYVKSLLRKPGSRREQEACNLCGDVFDTSDELAGHLGSHSLDFAEKRHECSDCHIFFANEKDLERHLQSANLNQHCGFTFRHVAGVCTGHHHPPHFKSSLPSDHQLMQNHLWAWELTQLQSHRVTVARILAQRLYRPGSRHMSVQDYKQTYRSLLPHVSVANRESLRVADSCWPDEETETEAASLDAYFGRLVSETFVNDHEILPQHQTKKFVRPDSLAMPPHLPAESQAASKKTKLNQTKRTSWAEIFQHHDKGHRRPQSGSAGRWKKTVSGISARPHSLPTNVTIVKLVA